jgi:Leucine-rich repeat (LRR) protein
MHRSIAKLALLLAAAAVSCGFFVATHAAGASCWPHERDALLAFKQGVSDTYDLLASWQKKCHDCCRWTGVTCSIQTGHVIELDVPFMDFVGQISPSLLSLQHLEYLDLSLSSLHGPNGHVFPEFLCSLHSLRHLDLSNTRFSGSVPAQLANLSKLEYLDLSGTLLSGTLPPQLGNLSNLRHLGLSFMQDLQASDISWLTNLHLLEYLDISDINLSTNDVFSVANTIPSLKALILNNCSLPNANQTLTHLNLTKLEDLDLSRNHLGHPIETCWFWNITGIKHLSLVETYLYGPFPDALGDMASLQHLEFNNNGNSATLMVDLKNLCHLETIWIDGGLAHGNITEFVRKLPQCSSSKLFMLSSMGNNMTGTLPDMLGHFTSLTTLSLSNNSITGAIPSGLRNLTSLETLDLSMNQLHGQIPMLPRSLNQLSISMNSLSGPLSLDFGGPNLTDLILSFNYLTGHLPRPICESKTLKLLDLSNNLFEGELPWYSFLPNMEFLLLSNNNLSGKFPSWL